MSNDLYKIIAKTLSISESDVSDESGPKTIKSWDQFNGLVLVDELENHFNVKLTLSEIINVENVADIKRHLKNHNVDLNG